VITGASSGLGAGLALSYAAPGRHLALTGRDAGRLEQIAAQARALGAAVTTAVLDVADPAAMVGFLADFDRAYPVDLMIANAGITSGTAPDGSLETLAQAREVIAINLGGVMNSVIPLIAPMQARGRGHFALIGSVAALKGLPDSPAYSASKAGVRLYGESIRPALAPYGIKVSVVLPGFFVSPMSRRFHGPHQFELTLDQAVARIRRGLDLAQARITLPRRLGILLRLADLLPAGLGDLIIKQSRFRIDPAAPPG
jgi:short-subunit dehydrogenase